MTSREPTTVDALAKLLFGHQEAKAAMPVWLDSGPDGGTHRLSACPDRVRHLRVDELPARGLAAYLREHLPERQGDGALHVILLAYDAGRNLEEIAPRAEVSPQLPDVVIARYPAWYEATGEDQAPRLCGDPSAQQELKAWLSASEPKPAPRLPTLSLRSSMSEEEHEDALRRVLEGIAQGALYQANIARRLSGPLRSDAIPRLYHQLRVANPAPYGALWAITEALWLASNSPECLLTWRPADGAVHSYPIKGTRPRGASREEDESLKADLRGDLKERAEHVMIVDLVRNDLGRVARPGSVAVRDLFAISSWSTVHHMVSDVYAAARDDVDLIDVLLALFPGGSITGAPKIAAMQWIEDVEAHRRGFYCGSLGVIGPQGDATFNILIRTCVHSEGTLYYQTGGGIVADSDPRAEWRETEVKARALIQALSEPL